MRGRVLRLPVVLLAIALAVSLVVCLGGCTPAKQTTGTTGGDASEPIKIGAIISETGTYAGLGEPEKRAIEMEVERINAAGGVNGRDIEVIIVDDATDEAKAVTAATKLIEQEKVIAIIGATGTGQTMAIRNEVDRAGIPNVSMAGGTVITEKFDKLVFQTPWSNTLVAPVLMDYLKTQGITKIGLISDSGGFGKDGQAVVGKVAKDKGIAVVSDQTFNPGDTDMSAQLTNIKKAGAQAVVMWTAGKEAVVIAKNMKDLDIGLPLYGSHGNARREFIEGAGEAAEGFKFPAGKILVPETYGQGTPAFQVATDFVDRFEKKYDKAPDTFAGHAYDALYLTVDAAKRVDGELTAQALRDEIEKTSGFVGIGGTFTYTGNDHNGLTSDDIVMYEVSDGDWKVIK